MEILTTLVAILIIAIVWGFIMLVVCLNTGLFPPPTSKDQHMLNALYWRKQ